MTTGISVIVERMEAVFGKIEHGWSSIPETDKEVLNGVLHLRGTNDSRGGIENDVVKKCSRGWVPS
jgi:hypothetical protein